MKETVQKKKTNQQVLWDTLQDVVHFASNKPVCVVRVAYYTLYDAYTIHFKVLTFMRTALKWREEEVLSVVLSDFDCLTHPMCDVKAAIGVVGMHNITKDFLVESSKDTYVCRNVNNIRRKCFVIRKSAIPQDIWAKLARGNDNHSVIMIITMQINPCMQYYTVTNIIIIHFK